MGFSANRQAFHDAATKPQVAHKKSKSEQMREDLAMLAEGLGVVAGPAGAATGAVLGSTVAPGLGTAGGAALGGAAGGAVGGGASAGGRMLTARDEERERRRAEAQMRRDQLMGNATQRR